MIPNISILRRLPINLDQKQLLLLDGIRHASEIINFAYNRLINTLTEIALTENGDFEDSILITSAFLDSWSIVDAIDRLRLLWAVITLKDDNFKPESSKPLSEITEQIRNLRNLGDHIAQRIPEIISKEGTALGVLSWFTFSDIEKGEGVSCIIVPGSFKNGYRQVVNPSGEVLLNQTGIVTLEAGGYSENLTKVVQEINRFIKFLEFELEKQFKEKFSEHKNLGSDMVMKFYMSPKPS